MELYITLGIIFFICCVGYFFIWKDRQRDKENIDSDWRMFLKSVDRDDINGIDSYGKKLIWNKYLSNNQLNRIIEEVDLRVNRYSTLQELKNLAFNKRLHFDRPLPYPGSSGGKKQSW